VPDISLARQSFGSIASTTADHEVNPALSIAASIVRHAWEISGAMIES
jgi:hypothetical protein